MKTDEYDGCIPLDEPLFAQKFKEKSNAVRRTTGKNVEHDHRRSVGRRVGRPRRDIRKITVDKD